MVQVILICLVLVCFFLETYSQISLESISVFYKINQKLYAIPDIKSQQQQFNLLPEMYFFVVNIHRGNLGFVQSGDYKWPQRHAAVVFLTKGKNIQ